MDALNASTYYLHQEPEKPAETRVPRNMGWSTAKPQWSEEPKNNWIHADGTKGTPATFATFDEPEAEESPAQTFMAVDTSEVERLPAQTRKSKKSRRRQNRQLRSLQQDLDEEMIQDYIDNMSDSGAYGVTNRPLGLESDEWLSSDMDEEDEAEEVIDQILADAQGDEMSDGSEMSSAYDSEEDDDEEGDESDLESELEYTEKERWEDELDLRQRQQDAMTDEEIARILAKQESLGMGGDEMYLFDDSGFGDLETARAGLESFSGNILRGYGAGKGSNKNAMRRGKKGRKSDHFPDASLMADVIEQDPYGGFDVMDFERPSLRPRNKGRKSGGSLPAELAALSDEELIDDLQSSWANDRRKKAAKKEEREELRKLGLLGGKGKKGKPDMMQRYQDGMDMQSVKIEIRDFLEEEHTTKAFPPMDKVDRKILHGIAEAFNLKSKSQGSGRNRFTIMIKTQRTIDWDPDHWHHVQSKAQRGFFPNMKTKGKKRDAPTKARAGRGGGFSKAAVSYANGEVVGAAAPEIAASSFGRKLMEKMGWEKGMALGKEGGDGEGRLLVPVQARIKSGKAGLG